MDNNELNNRRVHALAKAHDCTVAQVHDALDQHPVSTDRDTFLRRTLALELMRLDQLEMAFQDKAIRDKDVSSGLLLIKVAERRQVLLGLAAPAGRVVNVVHEPVVQRQTSTERIRSALDRIRLARPNGGEAN